MKLIKMLNTETNKIEEVEETGVRVMDGSIGGVIMPIKDNKAYTYNDWYYSIRVTKYKDLTWGK